MPRNRFAHAAHPSAPPAMVALQAESARTGLPLRFQTDLTTHDARAIAQLAPYEPFAWAVYNDGTHLAVAGGKLTMIMVSATFADVRYYVWNGRALESMRTARDADERLAEIAANRYRCAPIRKWQSFITYAFPTQREADDLAIEWERRYGEPFAAIEHVEGGAQCVSGRSSSSRTAIPTVPRSSGAREPTIESTRS